MERLSLNVILMKTSTVIWLLVGNYIYWLPELRFLCIKSVKEFAYTMLCICVMAIITCFLYSVFLLFFVDHVCLILFIKSDYFTRMVVYSFFWWLNKRGYVNQHPTNLTFCHFSIKFYFLFRFYLEIMRFHSII